jgi:hypothetical protein
MLNHQKLLATVGAGLPAARARSRSVSHTIGPRTSRFDCFQKWTSCSSRSNQPLPTTPCCAGRAPVSIELCTLHVTAGRSVVSVRMPPEARANSWSRGHFRRAKTLGERPTMLRTATRTQAG